MLSRVLSCGLRGPQAYLVSVELDIAKGLPSFAVVGLPDAAVREARQRVGAALRNSGFRIPPRRVTVSLAPAEARKRGSHFDLPMAVAMLAASGQLEPGPWADRYCLAGELALDGSLRPVRGALAMAALARERGMAAMIGPAGNAGEAALAGLPAYGAASLREVAQFLSGGAPPSARPAEEAVPAADPEPGLDLSDVRGQGFAKRALEIAAAGGHHILLLGPPGSGKSMLARRLPGLLPDLTPEEAVEAARIRSSCREGGGSGPMIRRPFRAPHHAASHAALAGGGPQAGPGEVSLAHGGVLFLDELPEFNRAALESLRQPLEDGTVWVARAQESAEYPARFLLAAAANWCPCGWRGHPARTCACAPTAVARYLGRISGPLLDRIDLQVEVSPVPFEDWAGRGPGGSPATTAEVRERVAQARRRQSSRYGAGALNARAAARELRSACALDEEALRLLAEAARRHGLSARSLDRLLRVGRTVADLEGSASVSRGHLAEALQYRRLDRTRI